MNKILITGASGFIGAHLIRRLLSESRHVSIFVRDKKKVDKNIKKKVRIFEGDLLDKRTLKAFPPDIDSVVHLAACFEDNDKVKNSSGYDVSRVNAEGTANLAEAVSRGNLKHFILASSISVYDGLMTSDVINESTTARPDNAYGRSKVESERIVCETASVSGFKATILRIPFVYGPGNKRNIYRMIQAVDRGRFFMIGSGQNSRSAVYVGNLVDAISLVLNDEGCHSGLYIVTDNKDYTLMEIYSAIAEALGKTPSKIFIPKNLGKFCARILDVLEKITGRTFCFDSDIYKRLTRTFRFSCEKIRRELGYIPKKDLYSAIDETIEWYKKTGK